MSQSTAVTDRRKLVAKVAIAGVLISLFVLVFLPSFFLISFTFTEWPNVHTEVFANPFIGDTNWREILKHLALSLRLATSAVLIDLLFGIPLATY